MSDLKKTEEEGKKLISLIGMILIIVIIFNIHDRNYNEPDDPSTVKLIVKGTARGVKNIFTGFFDLIGGQEQVKEDVKRSVKDAKEGFKEGVGEETMKDINEGVNKVKKEVKKSKKEIEKEISENIK